LTVRKRALEVVDAPRRAESTGAAEPLGPGSADDQDMHWKRKKKRDS
jgi:hypothetical protein